MVFIKRERGRNDSENRFIQTVGTMKFVGWSKAGARRNKLIVEKCENWEGELNF